VRAPQIPPMPRRIKNPYLLEVTKELTSEMIPSAAKPNSKTTEAGNRSDSRPAKSRNAAKQSEYDVMIWRQIDLQLTLHNSPRPIAILPTECRSQSARRPLSVSN